MKDDLVKRLKRLSIEITDREKHPYRWSDEFIAMKVNKAADRIEQLQAVLRLGVDMREKQKAYFKRRFQDVLLDCKKAERDFDVSALAALGDKKND